MGRLAVGAWVALGFISSCCAPAHAGLRTFAVDDLFELEDVGEYFGGPYAFAADGQHLAYTRVRPKRAWGSARWEYIGANNGGDVWVQMYSGQQAFPITQGASDGSAWWSPSWSPDTKRLALLGTRGGNICLWVWDTTSRELRQVTEHSNAISLYGSFYWLDARHVLYPATPQTTPPQQLELGLQAKALASAAWIKSNIRTDVTASALDSGVPADSSGSLSDQLLILDVTTGREAIIESGNIRSLVVSPSGHAFAYLRQFAIHAPHANEAAGFVSEQWELRLSLASGIAIPLQGPVSHDILLESIRWSPDGTRLAYIGYAEDRAHAPDLYCQPASKTDHLPTSKIDQGISVSLGRFAAPSSHLMAERSSVCRVSGRHFDFF